LKEAGRFCDCLKLARIDIPENAPLENIPEGFASDTSLVQFKFPSAVKTIGTYAFSGTKLTSVELPDGVEILGLNRYGNRAIDFAYCFSGCKELTSVKLPKGLQFVGDNCFTDCPNLAEVIVPEGTGKVEWGWYDGGTFRGTHLNLKSQAALKALGYTGSF
ncbi:MAG: leucine-rich repeat domain-containing protein, partial [Treponema sp.]|nr:leucine-rich repeat domain-containing protein [Treponema sp.]